MEAQQNPIQLTPLSVGSILAATGHRPDKLGGYSEAVDLALFKLATHCLTQLKPTGVLSGMALGWDMAIAYAAIKLGIPVTACVPFNGQESVWPDASKQRYHAILVKCDTIHVVSPGGFAAWKMQKRNAYMVDHSNALLALWNGSDGGTANCITYGLGHMDRHEDYRIMNVWDEWVNLYAPGVKS